MHRYIAVHTGVTMKGIRWASSGTLAIALGFLGCGRNSTTTKDASVDRRGTDDVARAVRKPIGKIVV
jgi:hypothetical protein